MESVSEAKVLVFVGIIKQCLKIEFTNLSNNELSRFHLLVFGLSPLFKQIQPQEYDLRKLSAVNEHLEDSRNRLDLEQAEQI